MSAIAQIIEDHTVYPRVGGQMCNGAECAWRSWEDGGSHAEHVEKVIRAATDRDPNTGRGFVPCNGDDCPGERHEYDRLYGTGICPGRPASLTLTPTRDVMSEHSAESEVPPPLDEWLTEWAVEVTWRDWKAAGAKGPTSQYGPFEHPYQRDQFLARQRRDRDIVATRVLTRRAAYTPWTGFDHSDPTTTEEREALLMQEWERINGTRVTPLGGSDA